MQVPSAALTTILLVRHGETLWNAEGRLQGSNDIALNDEGVAQGRHCAAAVAAQSVRPTAVYSSPLVRAFRTAELIVSALDEDVGVKTDARLTERGLGALEGKTKVRGSH